MDSFVLFRISIWLLIVTNLVTSLTMKDMQMEHGSLYPSSDRWCSNKILKDRRGVITSPNYPNMYPNHISCTWHILAEIGEIITIVFQDMDIEEDSGLCDKPPCCIFNWIKIGPSLNGSEREHCGQDGQNPPMFVSMFSKAWIKFHISSVQSGGRGFKLFYTVGSRQGRSCRIDEFECSKVQCISQTLRCNGVPDCNDGSDEEFCSELCVSGKSCRDTFSCYDKHKQCDGNMDCLDFSDELGCGMCSTNETRCGREQDQCYNPVTQRCNNIIDCTNGLDEKDCMNACPGKIVCASKSGCYTTDERCDGIAQCSDSSDEKDCLPGLCNYDRGGFLCDNGRCIREIWKCDHTDDCGDSTDESNCLRNSVLTAAVMGSLICALLLVIAISCTCRLYSLRALENRMSSRETTFHRLSQEYLFREPPPSYAVAVGEHCRNLCVENIHYNSCPRRNRRRTRRARRLHESRRSSVATLDPARNQNMTCQPFNFFYPCTSGLPSLVTSLPNLILAQNNENNTVSFSDSNVNNDQPDTLTICEAESVQEIRNCNGRNSLESPKEESNTVSFSTDAESSFSEQTDASKLKNADCKEGILELVSAVEVQNETSSEELSSLPNESSLCDIEPLIR